MKKIPFLVLSALSMLIFSCSNNKEFAQVFKGNDWINIKTLGSFGGYEGDVCSRIDSVYHDSYGFRKKTNEITPNPIKRVKISLWLKVEDINKKLNLAISLSEKNKAILWEGIDIKSFIKINEANKWYKFEFTKLLPEYEVEDAQFETYVYNSDNNIVYIDDFQIRFFEE